MSGVWIAECIVLGLFLLGWAVCTWLYITDKGST